MTTRLQEASSLTSREVQRRDRQHRASQQIRDRMPDLLLEGGRPCSYAIWALLRLWDRHGEGNATPAAVRAERARLLPDHEDTPA